MWRTKLPNLFLCFNIDCGGQSYQTYSFALLLPVEDKVLLYYELWRTKYLDIFLCAIVYYGGQSNWTYYFALLLTMADKVAEHIALLYY